VISPPTRSAASIVPPAERDAIVLEGHEAPRKGEMIRLARDAP